MSVNAVNSGAVATAYTCDYNAPKINEDVKTSEIAEETGAVYEASEGTEKKATYSVNKMSAEERAALVDQLKADAEARQNQLISLVQQMMNQQTNAYGQANNIWEFLASGNYTVDPATQAQAQADIAEDGYYGVKQTSERIFDFACALAGDDVDKMKEMQAAFEEGFKQAEETWGGKLPDISYETQEAVNKKFEEYYAAMGVEA
ncbi:MAG: hypothetical protein IJX66_01165 [Lachnospiraceae bacterium]|nr:hypothetical protein [Lachnospiraceae bacterium]